MLATILVFLHRVKLALQLTDRKPLRHSANHWCIDVKEGVWVQITAAALLDNGDKVCRAHTNLCGGGSCIPGGDLPPQIEYFLANLQGTVP
ncbi:MAG TPA: hypothetical protein VLX68_08195 [Chitinivibrionales bacterium]|nr:hypothetical protein [Chitinivibrionales bacterium]